MNWHWKASLTSYLSIHKKSLPFTTMEEMVSSGYTVTLRGGGTYEEEFKQAAEGSAFASSWGQIKQENLVKTTQEAIELTLKEKVALYANDFSTRNTKEFR